MAPFDIFKVPENGKEEKIGETLTPNGSLSRMLSDVADQGEEVLGVERHKREEGDGYTVSSETKDGKIVGRTSIFRKQ